ncbi:MAG TPA: 4'-phosphopantetheinyl transferase superfamily protein [Syntrophales bacterium]|nr:4'-phosphopantetheinyl transferase superfamily protein [Syntrophales bacterium]
MDLRYPERVGKSRDTRFVSRVFTADERALISSSSAADAMLWTLWAGKEAAFKVMKKYRPDISSVPRAYTVRPVEWEGGCISLGMAETPEGAVPVRFFHDAARSIHAVGAGRTGDLGDVVWGVEVIDDGGAAVSTTDQSLLVREALIRRLSAHTGLGTARMEVRRLGDSRRLSPPVLFVDGRPADVDISLSHDGRFIAYAFITSL